MQRTQGAKHLHLAAFLGFGCVLTGICADRLNLFLPLDGCFPAPRFSNQSPMRDLMPVASVTEWRSAPGFPFSSGAQPSPAGLARQSSGQPGYRDAPSMVVSPRGSKARWSRRTWKAIVKSLRAMATRALLAPLIFRCSYWTRSRASLAMAGETASTKAQRSHLLPCLMILPCQVFPPLE